MFIKINERLQLALSGGFTYSNCVLIKDSVNGIIETGAEKKIIEQINTDSIDRVLYTHHHFDHIRNNELFPQAEVMIHKEDYLPMTDFNLFIHYNSIDMWENLMPDYDYEESAIVMGLNESELIRSWHIDSAFEDKECFDFGKTKVEVIHTPGHSAGHCAFWFPEEEFLFTGDVCLTKVGPWYGEIYADPEKMIKSIGRLIALKPKKLASSHIQEICEDGVDRLIEYKDRIFKRDERIYKYLKNNTVNVHEIAKQCLIYRMHPTPFVLFWEKLILTKHLDRLEKKGLIERAENNTYRAI